MITPTRTPPGNGPRGAALYVVLVVLWLTAMLALWSARSALFNERLAGNESDYQRAFEAAQAMLDDAQLDIQQLQADGMPCESEADAPLKCRATIAEHWRFDASGLPDMLAHLASFPTGCANGLCVRHDGAQDFWSDRVLLAQMTAEGVGARFGQFTSATAAATTRSDADLQHAWYWIEILPYPTPQIALLTRFQDNTPVRQFAPHSARPWMVRITALARGQRAGTEVVLQTVVVQHPLE